MLRRVPAPDHPASYLRMTTDPGSAAVWRRFSEPVQVIETRQLSQVRACLQEVEALTRTGLYAVGWVSAEAAAAFEPALPAPPADDFPLLHFALYEGFEEAAPEEGDGFGLGEWQPDTTRQRYDHAIATIRQKIAAGETYQTNYTLRLRTAFTGDDLSYFTRLTQAQPTEYAAYIAAGRWRVLSVSPELFFRRTGDLLTTKPMKGTTGRGHTEAEDARQAAWLASSPKNRAENVMIVDLLRNDLGRVARFGSVQVTELCAVERLPTLHTMTSTIRAELQQTTSLDDIFEALFPCGSVTGAPKISTLQVIRELEPSPRRVYCGAVGLIEPNGSAVFNVPIRTVLLDLHAGQAEFGVGGGITWDSDAAGEYEEVLTKARVLGATRPEFSLLETLRLEGGELRDPALHLQRMASSARYFGFHFDAVAAQEALAQAAAAPRGPGPFRVRLLCAPDGQLSVQAVPLGHNPDPVTVHLARRPVDSGDVFLFHKTTRREVYEAHTAGLPAGHDVLLHNERGELTEFTTGNVLVQLEGQLYTPPQHCGLLAGIARQVALQRGEVQERELRLPDLAAAEAVWHTNSLRGWRRVKWSG